MRMTSAAAALLLVACNVHALADGTILDTDFSQLPEGWYASTAWSFGDEGAVVQTTLDGWDALLFTGEGPREMIYLVPDGTDSVVIRIPYTLDASVSEGSVEFWIELASTGTAWNEIWREEIGWEGSIQQTDTIRYTPYWISGGDWMGLDFEGNGLCLDTGSMDVLWQVHGLSIVAYGDSLAAEMRTWGGIKAR